MPVEIIRFYLNENSEEVSDQAKTLEGKPRLKLGRKRLGLKIEEESVKVRVQAPPNEPLRAIIVDDEGEIEHEIDRKIASEGFEFSRPQRLIIPPSEHSRGAEIIHKPSK